ncbi:hypothetical protein [Pseudomonas frederiksbergensis]|nr:hypothetical protein [Pseudomonas frederiksbergensis]
MTGFQLATDSQIGHIAVPGGFAAADGQGFFPYMVMMGLVSFI